MLDVTIDIKGIKLNFDIHNNPKLYIRCVIRVSGRCIWSYKSLCGREKSFVKETPSDAFAWILLSLLDALMFAQLTVNALYLKAAVKKNHQMHLFHWEEKLLSSTLSDDKPLISLMVRNQ